MAAIDAARNLNLLILIGDQSDMYRFRHEIIRETILDELPLSDRVRIHMRCASELERLRISGFVISTSELLHHFRQSKIVHGSDKVAEYAMEAAELAIEQHDYDAAMELLDIGIAESSSLSSAIAARLYAKKARVHTYIGEFWSVRGFIAKHYTESIRNAIASDDPVLLREVVDEIRWPFPMSEQLNELLDTAADKLDDDHLRELTVMTRAVTRTLHSDGMRDEYLLEFVRKAESWIDVALATRLRMLRARDFHIVGSFQRQLDEIHAARALQAGKSDELVQLIGMRSEIDALGRLLRHNEALRIAESLKPLCVRHPYSVEARSLLSQLSFLYLKEADWDAFDRLVEDLDNMRPRISYPAYEWYRITGLVDRDALTEAKDAIGKAIDSVRDLFGAWVLSAAPRYTIHAGDIEFIDVMLEIADRGKADDIANRWDATAVVARAIWAFYRADVTVFEPELRQIDPELVDAGWELTGFLFEAIGDAEEACRRYTTGLEEERFHRPRVGWLLYRLAKLHWKSDRAAATEWFLKARAHARRYRLTRVERLLTEFEAQPTRTKNIAGLTQREIDVLREVTAGKTDAEIAETLFISTKTVSNHVGNILRKTGTANRTEATRYAVDRGIVDESNPVAL
jgi:DNA-binding CsgD family transcriptional regulator